MYILMRLPWILATAAIVFFLSTFGAWAKHMSSGDSIMVGGFCRSYEDIRELSDAIARDGLTGYTRVMFDQDSSCIDSRFHFFPKFPATLDKLGWIVEPPDGPSMEIWSMYDRRGDTGYVWIIVPGDPV